MNADFPALTTSKQDRSPIIEHAPINLRTGPEAGPDSRLPYCPIAGIEPCSLIDFPGHIAAVVFLAGCNLNCSYCHNRDLINPSLTRDVMGISGLLSFLKARQILLDGVVITGGEPSLHPDLAAFIGLIRLLGYKIKLDSNGTRPEVLAELLNKDLIDYLAMDIKAAPQDAQLYSKICGTTVDIANIRQSIQVIKHHAENHPKFEYEFRTTVCEDLDVQDIMGIGAAIAGARCYALQTCRPSAAQPNSTLEELATLIGPMYNIARVVVR